jgi:hypothetical protein
MIRQFDANLEAEALYDLGPGIRRDERIIVGRAR